MRAAVAAFFLAALPAAANEFCDVPGRVQEVGREKEEKWALFKARKFAGVETFHAGLVSQHEAGRISDARLKRYLGAFQQAEAWVEPLLLEWVRLYPRSYAARYALAAHYSQAGFLARGTEYSPKTSDEQFETMRRHFTKAAKVLDEADRLTTKPTLSQALRIDMGAAAGIADPTAIYRAALKAHPDTMQVRIDYILKSAPRWGGSVKRLNSILDDAAGLPEADRRYVRYLVLQQLGSAMHDEKQHAKEVEYFKESAALCKGIDRSLQMLLTAQRIHFGDWDGMIATATELIHRRPYDGDVFETRGWAYQRVSRFPEAAADYRKAIELGSHASNFFLAGLYETGQGVQKDLHKALELFLVADRHRVKDARQKAAGIAKSLGVAIK